MMRSEDIRDRLRDIDEYFLNQYKENKKIEKLDWQTAIDESDQRSIS